MRTGDREYSTVMGKDIVLGDAKLEVKDIQELAFYPSDIALAKDSSAKCPMNILECGVVKILSLRR